MIRALFQGRPVAAVITILCAAATLLAFAAGPGVAAIAAAVAITPTILIGVLAIIRRKPRPRGAQE